MWLFRNASAIPNLLIVLGAVLAAYNGHTLYMHESLSSAEIEQRAQEQLEALEERRGPLLDPIQGERRAALLERLEAEVQGIHERPRNEAARWFFLGLGCLIIGLGHRVSLVIQQRFFER